MIQLIWANETEAVLSPASLTNRQNYLILIEKQLSSSIWVWDPSRAFLAC